MKNLKARVTFTRSGVFNVTLHTRKGLGLQEREEGYEEKSTVRLIVFGAYFGNFNG